MSDLLLLLAALGGALIGFTSIVLLWAAQSLWAKEAEAGIQALTSTLLRRAEQRLPPAHRSRFREETRAGLLRFNEKRPLWTLLQALSLFSASLSGRLGAEIGAASEPVEAEEAVKGGEKDAAEAFAAPAKVSAHSARIRILIGLAERPATSIELARKLGCGPAWAAYYLARLTNEGLVEIIQSERVRGVVRHTYRTKR